MGDMAEFYNDLGMDMDEGGHDAWSDTRVDEYGHEVMDSIHQRQAKFGQGKVWVYFGDYKVHTEGKFLFFANDPDILKKIVLDELQNGFYVGKISVKPRNEMYVLCLYDESDNRKHELFHKYGARTDVKYRWWKSNADTLAGKYSKEYR